MISAVTMRRVGQLIAENQTMRNRMEALTAERDFYLRRLADYQNLDLTQPTSEQHMTQT